MVFSNLMLIWVNHHVVAIVLQEAILKMGSNLSLKCAMFQYVQWTKSEKCVSSNVIHNHENIIEWHPLYCPDLAPFLFWKLRLALKGRRCDISIIQEQSPVVCSPNSGEESRNI